MDYLTALVELVKSLAWPISAIILACIFRQPLTELIGLIESVKFKDAEVKIARRIEQTKELQEKLVPPSPEALPIQAPNDRFRKVEDEIMDVIGSSPRSAIMIAWRTLEGAGAKAIQKLSLKELAPQLRPAVMFAEVLRREGKISSDKFKIISNLRRIRNDATHVDDFKITENSALDYVGIALTIARELENA